MKYAVLLACLVASAAFAAAKPGDVNTDNSGIITPNIATGMRRFNEFTFDTTGAMVACWAPAEPSRSGCDSSKGTNNGWRDIRDAVPAGKTYVGFRVVSRDYGYRQLEVYWK